MHIRAHSDVHMRAHANALRLTAAAASKSRFSRSRSSYLYELFMIVYITPRSWTESRGPRCVPPAPAAGAGARDARTVTSHHANETCTSAISSRVFRVVYTTSLRNTRPPSSARSIDPIWSSAVPRTAKLTAEDTTRASSRGADSAKNIIMAMSAEVQSTKSVGATPPGKKKSMNVRVVFPTDVELGATRPPVGEDMMANAIKRAKCILECIT